MTTSLKERLSSRDRLLFTSHAQNSAISSVVSQTESGASELIKALKPTELAKEISSFRNIDSDEFWTEVEALYSREGMFNEKFEAQIWEIFSCRNYIRVALLHELSLLQKVNSPDLETGGWIFESVWAISYISEVWNLLYTTVDFSSSEGGSSPVSEEYKHLDLKRMAFEKAYFHSLISKLDPSLARTPQKVQQILSGLSEEWRHYYPWAYSDDNRVIWVSATVIAENIALKISEMYKDKNLNIDEFAPKKW